MTKTRSAVAVLSTELDRPDPPTAHRLLEALRAAGLEIKPARGPAWRPTTPEAWKLVKQAADVHNSGLRNGYEIAERMGRGKRSVDRYLAAARAEGMLRSDRGEPPR